MFNYFGGIFVSVLEA